MECLMMLFGARKCNKAKRKSRSIRLTRGMALASFECVVVGLFRAVALHNATEAAWAETRIDKESGGQITSEVAAQC
jgi:hypothetical protein